MAEDKPPQEKKTLEMRVAELEDKLSKIHVTEEELKTYQKVSSLLGQGTSGPIVGTAAIPQVCVLNCWSCVRVAVVMHGCRMFQQGSVIPLLGESGSPATGFGTLGL